jgi:hypothetical protein
VGVGAGGQNPIEKAARSKGLCTGVSFVWEVCSYGANRDEAEGANREWQ